jgi:hypothetical protein
MNLFLGGIFSPWREINAKKEEVKKEGEKKDERF